MAMAARRVSSLTKWVQLLVEDWGYDEVYNALLELPQRKKPGYPGKKPGLPKRSAVEQIQRSNLPHDARQHLAKIAQKFDEKQFLPTIGDIKHFLAMSGIPYSDLPRHRVDIFRYLLPFFASLPSDRLLDIASNDLYSGPAQLGPLSDAISSTGEALRGSETPPSTAANVDTHSEEENVVQKS